MAGIVEHVAKVLLPVLICVLLGYGLLLVKTQFDTRLYGSPVSNVGSVDWPVATLAFGSEGASVTIGFIAVIGEHHHPALLHATISHHIPARGVLSGRTGTGCDRVYSGFNFADTCHVADCSDLLGNGTGNGHVQVVTGFSQMGDIRWK
ncbi:MAG: hypothetical protein K5905_10970 [Roseibium sp.]|uniref:hypothetical protein n=1 Tax=Roseibium sp. TaxID=1936156 RepID=UPI002610FCF7|nr:hypothetical protein [Roseibium sp.]MCV0425987.1 hypothetical protein [Roseibium sp.]